VPVVVPLVLLDVLVDALFDVLLKLRAGRNKEAAGVPGGLWANPGE